MPTTVLCSPLRTLRRTWGFTQRKLARLINFSDVTSISRFESGKRALPPDVIAAYAVVFGKTMAELCPERFAKIEECVVCTAREMWDELRSDQSEEGARQREFLALVLKRAVIRANQQEV